MDDNAWQPDEKSLDELISTFLTDPDVISAVKKLDKLTMKYTDFVEVKYKLDAKMNGRTVPLTFALQIGESESEKDE